MQYLSPNATLDYCYQTVSVVTSRWSHLFHIVHHSIEWCAVVFSFYCLVHQSTLLRYADKRTDTIYTTKIDEVVCPPNISETVALRTVKLAHRPCIASTTIKFISKPILLSILQIILKTIKPIGADANRKPSPPFDSANSVPSLGHSCSGSG